MLGSLRPAHQIVDRLTAVPAVLLSRKVSTIPSVPPGSYARDGGTSGTHLYSDKWHRELGSIFRDNDIGSVFIACPDMCNKILSQGEKYPQHFIPPPWGLHLQTSGRRRGLFFLEGEEWWQARQLLNPHLLKKTSLHSMEADLETATQDTLQEWRLHGIKNLNLELTRWLTISMMRAFLGNRITKELLEELLNVFVDNAKGIFSTTAELMLMDCADAARRDLKVWRDFITHTETALDTLANTIRGNIAPGEGVGGRLLSQGVSVEDVERLLSDLLLAAVDTNCVTATWALHIISTHSDIQTRIIDEIDEVCGGQPVRVSHLQHLTYLKGFLKETTRLYPVAPFLTRILSERTEVGSYTLEPDSLVILSTYTMSRMEELFPRPLEVLPERWLRTQPTAADARARKRQAISSLPFGHGIRGCIGRRLAEVELQLLLASLLAEFRLVSDNGPVNYITRMIGVPDTDINIKLQTLKQN